jgi:hypothetical protein
MLDSPSNTVVGASRPAAASASATVLLGESSIEEMWLVMFGLAAPFSLGG